MFAERDLIDLSVTVGEDLPGSWPTHMPFQRKVWNWYADMPTETGGTLSSRLGPYHTAWLVLDEHCGTHCDAPAHFIPPPGSGLPHAGAAGSITGDKLDLRQLMGPADVIDVTALSGTGEHGFSPTISPGRIQAWEERHGPIAAGDIVLLYSGWDRYYQPGPEGQKYAHDALVCGTAPGWPVPEPATIDYLHARGVRCVGTDGVSIGGPRGGAPPHVAGLSKGMAYVELLTNLGRLPARGASFLFLPVKVAGSSGGPGRAIAFVPRV